MVHQLKLIKLPICNMYFFAVFTVLPNEAINAVLVTLCTVVLVFNPVLTSCWSSINVMWNVHSRWGSCCDVGHEKCVLVGHDWGGAVAWCYTAMYPERVERLITCNIPHPTAMEKHMRSSLSQLRKLWYVFDSFHKYQSMERIEYQHRIIYIIYFTTEMVAKKTKKTHIHNYTD